MANKQMTFFAAIIGNILEYYDFTVYLIFSVTIGKVFFSNSSELIQILSSLAVFATGFITRPIGGILFGHLGDKYGRKVSLVVSMLNMTISTFFMGLLPSYDAVGVYSPMLLILLRLLQGLCISGEGANTAIFILEHYNTKYPGFISGLVHGTNIVGTLLASLIGIVINKYFSDIVFAWRIAFILGGIFGLIGFYLRWKVAETPIFLELQKKKKIKKLPLFDVINKSPYSIILTFCTGAIVSSIVYLVKSYINVYYSTVMHLDTSTVLYYLSYASIILIISMPIFGLFMDYFGNRVIKVYTLSIVIMIIPIMILMGSSELWQHILSITLLSILAGALSSSSYLFIISLFPAEGRSSGVSFSYNLGIALFGGASPIISRVLVEVTGLSYSPGFYMILLSLLYIVILNTFLPKTNINFSQFK